MQKIGKKTNRLSQILAPNKVLKNDLDIVCYEIQKRLNEISLVGLELLKQWLDNIYNNFSKKKLKDKMQKFSYWLKFIIDNPHKFENSVGEMGLSKSRIKRFNINYFA